MYFAYRQPETFRGVVGGMYFHVAFYTAKIEHVERVDIDAGIAVDIWNAEEIFNILYVYVCLFFYLTPDAFLSCFIHVTKTAWKVESAFCRLFRTLYHKEFIFLVDDKCRCGGTGICIIHKSTVLAQFAFLVVYNKVLTATPWAIFKFF